MADAMDVDAPPQPPTVVAGAPVPEAPPAAPSPEVVDEDRYMVAPDMEGDPEDSMPSD